MTQHLLPDLPGFSIEQITASNGVITVLACSQTTSGQCPECAHLSSRIHSRYQRRGLGRLLLQKLFTGLQDIESDNNPSRSRREGFSLCTPHLHCPAP